MALTKKFVTSALAGLTLLAATGAAMAAPASATANVNVRSGPGTGYGVVDVLRRGERVDVQNCRGSWCFVEKRGPDGWVSANYLSRGGGWDDDDDWDGGWSPRPPRPPRWDDQYPPRPPHWDPRPRPPHWNPRPRTHYPSYPSYPRRPDSSVCFNGPNGYFCVGN
jgi:hypothetical protein